MKNREIKFRAWDKSEKQMYLSPREIWGLGSWFESHCNSAVKDAVIFMQYTGLKDKNGKEIYEGDVCKGNFYYADEFGDSTGSEQEDVFVIEWRESHPFYGFNLIKADSLNKIEVIGNIYENPELLK